MKHFRDAFTLIELLVVVAIIALLISILLPSLSRARATVRVVKCMAIEKQMSQAAVMYADNQNNYFPPIWVANNATWWNSRWTANMVYRQIIGIDATNTFVEPEGLFCPDAPEIEVTTNNWGSIYGQNNNGLVFGVRQGNNGGTAPMVCVNRSKLTHPSDKIQFVDATDWAAPGVWDAVNPEVRWKNNGDNSPTRPGGSWHAAYRHLGGVGLNAAHYDGHGEFYNGKDAWTVGGGIGTQGGNAEIRKWELPR